MIDIIRSILKSAATTTRSKSKQVSHNIPNAATQTNLYKDTIEINKDWCKYCKRDHAPKDCTFKDINKEVRKSSVKVGNGRRALGLEEGKEVDKDMQVVSWITKEHLKDAYVHGMTHCPVWKDIYTKKKTLNNITFRDNFMYGWSQMGQWRLIIPSKITVKGKNFVETLISEAHEDTIYGGIEKTTKALTDKY